MAIQLERLQSSLFNEGLTPQEQDLRTLFTLSFQYSQGQEKLQHDLHRWNRINGFIPDVLPADVPSYIINITPPSLHDPIAQDKYMKQGAIQREWGKFVEIINEENKESVPKDKLLLRITEIMVKRDAIFQYRKRPMREEDPHKSFVRKHAVIGNTAGHESYNSLFEKVAGVIERYRQGIETSPAVRQLEIPPGKDKVDGEIYQLNLFTALQHLVLMWNFNHKSSGETFFKAS